MTAPLAPYPTPEARDALVRTHADTLRADVLVYGQSAEGRPLLAVRVPAKAEHARRVLVTGNIHGLEFVSCLVALGVLEALPHDPALERLRTRAELWVVPCANPDGYARTFAAGGTGRLAELRPNARGVDLNRNFPLPAGHERRRYPGAGSHRPGAATYVGPAPLSEPETWHLDVLMRDHPFCAAINGHSFMGKVIPARVLTRTDYRTYARLCAAASAAQPLVRYGRLASPILDAFTGEIEDHQHHGHGMWAACLETFSLGASLRQHLRAPNLFWRFNPRDPGPWVQNDVPALTAFLAAALDQPRPSSAPHARAAQGRSARSALPSVTAATDLASKRVRMATA
ncbi:MAG: hypothetical protein KA712_20000 [Myxococcales bacterium]|nr:hypothetical protein [Myxococcales bacterium]